MLRRPFHILTFVQMPKQFLFHLLQIAQFQKLLILEEKKNWMICKLYSEILASYSNKIQIVDVVYVNILGKSILLFFYWQTTSRA